MVNTDVFELNALKAHWTSTYSRAFKGATVEYAKNCAERTSSQKGKGAQAMANCWNTLELYSPSDKKLTRTMISRAVNAGWIGVSLLKMQKPVKVVPEITGQFAREAAMIQVSGTGESTCTKIAKRSQALTVGTAYINTRNLKYTFCKA